MNEDRDVRVRGRGRTWWLALATIIYGLVFSQWDLISEQWRYLRSAGIQAPASSGPQQSGSVEAPAGGEQAERSLQSLPLTSHQAAIYRIPGGSPEADLQIANVPRYNDYPGIPMKVFIAALENADYAELERLYREQELLIVKQPFAELSYSNFIYALSASDGVSLQQLNNWVETTGSEFSYVARAAYLTAAAWDARGTKFASKTSDDEWEAFRRIADMAAKDALIATEMNGRSYGAYLTFFRLIGSSAEPLGRESLAQVIDEIFPWSLRMRVSYMNKLQPRWHGSFEEMDQFAAQSIKYVSLNPQLWLLQGSSHAEKAEIAHGEGDYKLCLEESNLALQYGIHSAWLTTRADCLEHLQEYELALRDVEQSLSIKQSPGALRVQNKIYEKISTSQ